MANEEMALLAELTEMPDFGDPSFTRTQDVMQALGIGLNLDALVPEPLQRRERRQTGGSSRARYDPEEYDTADRSRARKGTRLAPPLGSPRHNETRNHATKRNKLAKDLGGGMLGVRKLYLCRWCGLPKKNHSCEGAVDPELLASRQQAARSLTAPQQDAAMSSSSSTGSTAEEEGGSDEVETVVAPSPKLRAWHPPRKELGLSVDTHGWHAQASAEVSTGVNAVGKRIEGVFLCEGALLQWYGGLITEFSESSGEHLVVYDDGEQKWHLLLEGVAQQALRWPDACVGADGVSSILPSSSTSTDQRKGLSLSSRKRRERSAEPEPAFVERDSPAAQVCDYCNSRGKVHRRCMRLPTCHIVWKRGGKKKRDSIGDLSDLRRTTPSTPPTPAAEHVRTGREKGVAPGKRAQVMNARCKSSAMQPDADDAGDADDADDVEECVARYDFVQSQDWPFPIIVPPEALGISFEGVAKAATVDFKQAASAEEEAAAEAAEAVAKELLVDIELPLF